MTDEFVLQQRRLFELSYPRPSVVEARQRVIPHVIWLIYYKLPPEQRRVTIAAKKLMVMTRPRQFPGLGT